VGYTIDAFVLAFLYLLFLLVWRAVHPMLPGTLGRLPAVRTSTRGILQSIGLLIISGGILFAVMAPMFSDIRCSSRPGLTECRTFRPWNPDRIALVAGTVAIGLLLIVWAERRVRPGRPRIDFPH
jgi:hypothetical protein